MTGRRPPGGCGWAHAWVTGARLSDPFRGRHDFSENGDEPQPDASEVFRFDAPEEVLRYVVHKGSITVDGISLTVAAVHDDGFQVAVIPHTLAVTTLGFRQPGDTVNLEIDMFAKYAMKALAQMK